MVTGSFLMKWKAFLKETTLLRIGFVVKSKDLRKNIDFY